MTVPRDRNLLAFSAFVRRGCGTENAGEKLTGFFLV
jgi:hypothetical protein